MSSLSVTAAPSPADGQAHPPQSVEIVEGSEVVFKWTADGVASLHVEPGVGEVDVNDGQLSLPVSKTTRFTFDGVDANGDLVARAEVLVGTHKPGDIVSPHAVMPHAGPASKPLAGTLTNELGEVLKGWPFRLLDAHGKPVAAATRSKSSAGHYVTSAAGTYSFAAAPAGARVEAVAPLAPIDTSKPGDAAAGAGVLAWVKSKAEGLIGKVKDGGGELVGYAELAGVRYPVKAYSFKVSDQLTRGSRLDEAGLKDIASKGFKGAVNFCMEYDDSAEVTAAGLVPLHLSVLDNTAPSYSQVLAFLDFVTEPRFTPAYCHCEAGVGRTGEFVASYRLYVEKWSVADALAEAKKFGCALDSQYAFIERLGADIASGVFPGDLASYKGTLENQRGETLRHWLFKLDKGNQPAPIKLGGATVEQVGDGVFRSGPDGHYAVLGASGGATVKPLAELAPIDTSKGPLESAEGTAQTDGQPPHNFLSWLKTTAADVKDAVKDGAGEAVGYAELAGLRYPVKAYSAEVSPTLTRGSRLDKAGLALWAGKGFHGVVNFCREYDDSADVKAAGLNPLHLSVLDNTAPTDEQLEQFLDFVRAPANQPVYCHCEAGVGRTGVFCATYRMAVMGWSVNDAIAEAEKYGLSLKSQLDFLKRLGADIAAKRFPAP